MNSGEQRYDMTVVIPVYNAASHIGRCVASLDVQSMPQERFEVILVNDGSTDKSLALCKDMAQRRKNYVLLSQENQGVSAARNAGIRAARGRYIMFVDADDAVSKWAVEKLVTTFGLYERDVDLLTYPIEYVNLKSHAVRRHGRRKWLTSTGVYDLGAYPYVAQTTPNVCIRNEGDQTPMFPVGMRMGEDQYFNTEVLAKRGVLGFCADATYYHMQNDLSSSSLWDEPCYAFEDMMRLYTRLIQIARADAHMADYAYGLVLYNMAWRVKQDMLSLDFGDERTQRANHRRLSAVLCAVPLDCWQKSPYLNDVQRVYLMQRFEVVGAIVEALHAKNGTHVLFENDICLDLGHVCAQIYWAVREEEGLRIKGFLFSPVLDASSRLQMEFCWDGGRTEVAPVFVQRGKEVPDASERSAWHFCAELPPMDAKPYVATLRVTVNGQAIPTVDLLFNVCRSNGRRINAHTREFGDRRLTLREGALQVGTIKDLPAQTMPIVTRMMRVRDMRRTGDFDSAEVKEVRSYVSKARKRLANERFWLYVGADNALTDDLVRDDGVVRLDIEELESTSARFAALLLAERVISSHVDFKRLLTRDYRTWDRVADLTVPQTYVFVGEKTICLEGTPFDASISRV